MGLMAIAYRISRHDSPVWQVAYIVIARQMWKHHGEDVLPSIRTHWPGLLDLMGWFDRHADPADGLLVTKCYGDWMGFKVGGLDRPLAHPHQ